MPSASLKNRLKALEAAQAVENDDVYWTWVRENVDTHVDMFGKAIKGEVSLQEWDDWRAENLWPERGRPYTAEEERENERAREEFWKKIEQTRERLLSGAARGLFDNPAESKRKLIHDKNGIEDVPQRLAPGRE